MRNFLAPRPSEKHVAAEEQSDVEILEIDSVESAGAHTKRSFQLLNVLMAPDTKLYFSLITRKVTRHILRTLSWPRG